MVLKFLRRQMDLRGWHVLFVNDCLPVILALRKGSHSARLQADAEEVTQDLEEVLRQVRRVAIATWEAHARRSCREQRWRWASKIQPSAAT